MFPGHPSQLSGRLAITSEIDGSTSANIVIETKTGTAAGVYIDDSTPNIEKWIAIAVEKFSVVFVSVAPQANGAHHKPAPPVQNMYEAYSVTGPFPTNYDHLIVRWGYHDPPKAKRIAMLSRALTAVGDDPDRVWLF